MKEKKKREKKKVIVHRLSTFPQELFIIHLVSLIIWPFIFTLPPPLTVKKKKEKGIKGWENLCAQAVEISEEVLLFISFHLSFGPTPQRFSLPLVCGGRMKREKKIIDPGVNIYEEVLFYFFAFRL